MHPPDTTHFEPYGGPWPHHCVAGTDGAAFDPELRLPPHTVVISKGQDRADAGYSAFEGTTPDGRRLADELRERGVEKLIVGSLARVIALARPCSMPAATGSTSP